MAGFCVVSVGGGVDGAVCGVAGFTGGMTKSPLLPQALNSNAAAAGDRDETGGGHGGNLDSGLREVYDQTGARFAYATTSHFCPADSKFTCTRACAPAPSASITVPSPKLEWRTR